MKEIKIYLDNERNNEIHDEIRFETVVAGEITKQSIFIENITKWPINIKIDLSGELIDISKNIEMIQPGVIEEVEFEFTPKITTMKPVRAKLDIKLDYMIK